MLWVPNINTCTQTPAAVHTLTSLSGFAILGGGATGILGNDWLDVSGSIKKLHMIIHAKVYQNYLLTLTPGISS